MSQRKYTTELTAEFCQKNDKYRWYILALLTAIGLFVGSIQVSCLPVLFTEISNDLSLDIIQIGTIWGLGNFAGIFVSLLSGILIDRFGVKLVLSLICIMCGLTGALRGLSNTFLTLAIFVIINGIFRMIVPVAVTKTVGIWFKEKNLGLAMGVSSMGIGLGLALGPLISSTILSPVLGGWRDVLYFYGATAVAMGILWTIFGRAPYNTASDSVSSNMVPFRQALPKLIRNKGLWLIGLMMLFRGGSIMSMAGYIPLYLKQQGWEAHSADGTLAAFFAVSSLCSIPLCFLSDRLGKRKPIIYLALVVTLVCISLIPLVEGGMIWLLILLTGIFVDGSISLSFTMLLETKGIGFEYSGTAIGIVYTLIHIGTVSFPPLGASLVSIDLGMPLVFWASFSLLAIITLFLTKETGLKGSIEKSISQ